MSLASDPIVIYGAPRSGTTYLNKLLNAHPLVHVTHEMRLFTWAHEILAAPARDDQLLVTHRDEFLAHVAARLPGLIRDFYAARWPAIRHWGDKNPHYADAINRGCLGTIRRLFPGTKFIHLVRDGRDVVASLLRRRHDDGRPWADLATACHVWLDHTAIGADFGHGLPAGSYLELRYEDLVRDDLLLATRILGFLGIDMDPAVADFCARQRADRTAFSTPTRDLARGVLGSDWNETVSADDREEALALLSPGLERFGYEAGGKHRG